MGYVGSLIIFDLMNANGGLGATHIMHRWPRLPPLLSDLIVAEGVRVEAVGHLMLMVFHPEISVSA